MGASDQAVPAREPRNPDAGGKNRANVRRHYGRKRWMAMIGLEKLTNSSGRPSGTGRLSVT
jgi:hypothetical protein